MRGKAEAFVPATRTGTICKPSGEVDGRKLDRLLRHLLDVGGWEKPIGMPTFVGKLQRCVEDLGLRCNPVSRLNGKTAVPGWYRPIESKKDGGTTCHRSCPYRWADPPAWADPDDPGARGPGSCYALHSFVGWVQAAALVDVSASVVAAAVAMVGAVRYWLQSRGHVAGDFGKDADSVDWGYVRGLEALCSRLQHEFGAHVPLAWTYTHFETPDVPDLIRDLAHVGFVVRRSDRWEPGGAVVAPFSEVATLRRMTSLDLVKCPAQLSKDVTCATCPVCVKYPRKTVVFEPHGPAAAAIAEKAKLVFLKGWAPSTPGGAGGDPSSGRPTLKEVAR